MSADLILLQLTFGFRDLDLEEAAVAAESMERGVREAVLTALNEAGHSVEEASEVCVYYGTSVLMPRELAGSDL
jgi:hypothetical protein